MNNVIILLKKVRHLLLQFISRQKLKKSIEILQNDAKYVILNMNDIYKTTNTFGPISDLEKHLPNDWWATLFNAIYLKTDGDVVENEIKNMNCWKSADVFIKYRLMTNNVSAAIQLICKLRELIQSGISIKQIKPDMNNE